MAPHTSATVAHMFAIRDEQEGQGQRRESEAEHERQDPVADNRPENGDTRRGTRTKGHSRHSSESHPTDSLASRGTDRGDHLTNAPFVRGQPTCSRAHVISCPPWPSPHRAQHRRPAQRDLAGTVERVTFHMPRRLCRPEGQAARQARPRHPRRARTCHRRRRVGHRHRHLVHRPPARLAVQGRDAEGHPAHGAEGIEKYLASGYMRGIGPAMAKRIVGLFGEQTFEIIEAHPERLTEVGGIGPKRAERIVRGWSEQKAVREIMIFLHAHGVGTPERCIFKTTPRGIRVRTEDP